MGASRNLLIAAFAGAAAFAAAPASAAAFTYDFDGESGSFEHQHIAAGPIDDVATIDFKAGTGSFTISSTGSNAKTSIADLVAYFDGNAFTLTKTGSAKTGFQYVGNYGTPTNPITISAGSHTLEFKGTSGGNAGYSGQISFTAAVPEPASWAMMIGGFGVAGGALRRRTKTTKLSLA